MKLTSASLLLVIPLSIAIGCGGGKTESTTTPAPASEPGAGAQPPAQPVENVAAQGGTQTTAPAEGRPAAQSAATTAQQAAPASSAGTTTATSPAATVSTPAQTTAPAPPEPEYREVSIPAGTTLSLVLETPVASDASRVEDAVRAHTRQSVVVDGQRVIPTGAIVSGTVTEAQESGKVKGLASVSFRFNRVRIGSESYDIRTATITQEAEPTKAEDAKKVGIGAAGGAIVGGILGGKKGLGIGTAVGAGAGAGAVLATKGEEVRLAPGAVVTARLTEPLVVTIKVEKKQ